MIKDNIILKRLKNSLLKTLELELITAWYTSFILLHLHSSIIYNFADDNQIQFPLLWKYKINILTDFSNGLNKILTQASHWNINFSSDQTKDASYVIFRKTLKQNSYLFFNKNRVTQKTSHPGLGLVTIRF